MKTHLRWLPLAGLLGAALIQPGVNSLKADDVEATAALREKIEELDQQLRILERKLENSDEANTTKFKSIPDIKASDGGLRVTSKDKAYDFRIRGLLQLDYRSFIGDDSSQANGAGGSDNNDGFALRRVRPRFQGTLWERVDFEFTPEFAWSNEANNVRIIDTFANFKAYDELNFKFGLFKTPLGLERVQSAANTLFIERGLATNLVPTRDLGFQVHGKTWDEQLRYTAGVFNGGADSDDARTNQDTDESVDIDLSVFVEPFKKDGPLWLQGLGFGLAGTVGDHGGTFQNSGRTRYRSAGQNTASGSTNSTTSPLFDTNTAAYLYDGAFYRVNPQLYYYNGPFGFLGEYVYNTFDFKSATNPQATGHFESQAWTVQASYVLTGEDASYNGVKPLNPVSFKEGGIGAWEIGGRVGGVNVFGDAFENIGGDSLAANGSSSDAIAWGLAVNWYLNTNLRVSLNFEQTAFTGSFNNGAGAGFFTAGDKPTENLLLARFQVAF